MGACISRSATTTTGEEDVRSLRPHSLSPASASSSHRSQCQSISQRSASEDPDMYGSPPAVAADQLRRRSAIKPTTTTATTSGGGSGGGLIIIIKPDTTTTNHRPPPAHPGAWKQHGGSSDSDPYPSPRALAATRRGNNSNSNSNSRHTQGSSLSYLEPGLLQKRLPPQQQQCTPAFYAWSSYDTAPQVDPSCEVSPLNIRKK